MCSLLSLLLCALTVAWWTQSQGQVDQLTFEHTGSHAIRLWGSNGKLLVTRTVVPADYTKPIRFARDPQESNPLLLATSFSYASQPAHAKAPPPRLGEEDRAVVGRPIHPLPVFRERAG
jgi:hypothetical protein